MRFSREQIPLSKAYYYIAFYFCRYIVSESGTIILNLRNIGDKFHINIFIFYLNILISNDLLKLVFTADKNPSLAEI